MVAGSLKTALGMDHGSYGSPSLLRDNTAAAPTTANSLLHGNSLKHKDRQTPIPPSFHSSCRYHRLLPSAILRGTRDELHGAWGGAK